MLNPTRRPLDVSSQEVGSDPIVPALNGSKDANRIDAGERHEHKQSAETDRKEQARIAQQEE